MVLFYELEDGTEIEHEIEDWFEIKSAIKDIISDMNKHEIFEKMENCAEDTIDIEEQFREELTEYFKDEAIQKYKDSIQEQEDLVFDYYRDKL